MTQPHGQTADGTPVDLIGQTLRTGRGSVPGVTIVKPEEQTSMAKAEYDGVYTLNGHRYRITKGAVLPEGAEMDAPANDAPNTEAVEERAKPAAPENRAKAEKAESR